MTEDVEQIAQRIAGGGRDALLDRLRPAFERAAAAHADVLEIPPEQLEQMVQDAADRADGLQWRRALAGVASDQLGISLGEALRHPAVERAHEILGVPRYEDALASVSGPQSGAGAAAGPATGTPVGAGAASGAGVSAGTDATTADAEPRQVDESPERPGVEEARADQLEEEPGSRATELQDLEGSGPEGGEEAGWVDTELHDLPDQDEPGGGSVPAEAEAGARTGEDEDDAVERDGQREGAPPARQQPATVHVPAVHVSGIANLEEGEEGLELRFADPGVDIARENGAILGRIAWREIRTVEVSAGGLLRRRKAGEPRLVIRTERGDATFRVPGAEEGELRQRLAPALIRIPGGG